MRRQLLNLLARMKFDTWLQFTLNLGKIFPRIVKINEAGIGTGIFRKNLAR